MNNGEELKEEQVEFYLAQFDDLPAVITISNHNSQSVPLSGEILIRAQTDQEKPFVTRFQRISLWNTQIEPLGGQTALAGPANPLKFEPATGGVIQPFDMRIYYTRLGDQKPACKEVDATYPLIETLRGKMSWDVELSSKNSLRLRIEFDLSELVVEHIGDVVGLAAGPATLDLRRLEAGNPAEPLANSLSACSGSAPFGNNHDQRGLNLKFVNLSGLYPNAASIVNGETLEDIVKRQLAAACQVWWAKGGVKISPEPNIALPASPSTTAYNVSTVAQENGLFGTEASSNAVEVYLVDGLGSTSNPHPGGGVTHRCHSPDAYIILEIVKTQNNENLLAHEIGHVLGLAHPAGPSGGDCPSVRNGSYCSVMVPDSPNSSRNTNHNLQVLDLTLTLGSVFTSLGTLCNWEYDAEQGYFHLVRDFPYDDGSEDSVPQPPVEYWWTHSDVWNWGNATPTFNPDHSPAHSEPLRSATSVINNHMFVRLHTCQPLVNAAGSPVTVKVHLYLAVPGSASEKLKEITPAGGLIFAYPSSLPVAGAPVTQSISWIVESGYPSSCCVFAVAESDLDRPPEIADIVEHPLNHAFYNLFQRLKSDNDVAQRNLHIQEVSSAAASHSTMLNWIQVDNPLDKPATPSLEIDTRLVDGLQELSLEMDGETGARIKIGAVERIRLVEALPPGERLIVRLRAVPSKGLPEGRFLPINLGIYIGDEQVSGFQHVLRIAPLSRVIIQALDWLYAALEDVAVGCQITSAKRLAHRVGIILRREQQGITPPSGCLFWLWKLLGLRVGNWETELRMLSKDLDVLARRLIQADQRPECSEITRHLLALADLLKEGNPISGEELVEQVRELADRIQEPAGWLVRQAASGSS